MLLASTSPMEVSRAFSGRAHTTLAKSCTRPRIGAIAVSSSQQ